MRRPFFIVAFLLLTAVIGIEVGSTLFVQPATASESVLRRQLREDDVDGDDIDTAIEDLSDRVTDEPPGLAIATLVMLDVLLWLAVAGILASLFVPHNVLGRVIAPVNLFVSLLVILGGILFVIFALVLLFLMIGLFLAPPFGTIAYLARWGAFPRGGAQVTLGLLFVLKLAFCGFALVASPRFLQQKALVVAIVLSIVLQLVVSFLHNLVPVVLVSITDVVAAIIVAIVAIIWAIWVLIGSLTGTIRILALRRA